MTPELRALILPTLILAALPLLAGGRAAADQTATLTPMSTLEAIGELSARGYRDLREIKPESDGYRATVRDGSGRLRTLEVDAITGTIKPAETSAIWRNAIDPDLFVRLRGSLAPALPEGARPVSEVVPIVMAKGDWQDVHSVSVADDHYLMTVEDAEGGTVQLRVDPRTATVQPR